MKKRQSTVIKLFAIVVALPLLFSCCAGNKTSKTISKEKPKQKSSKVFIIEQPTRRMIVAQNNSFDIILSSDKEIFPDSITLFHRSSKIDVEFKEVLKYIGTAKTNYVGEQSFRLNIFHSDSLKESHSFQLFILPTVVPKFYNYKVLRSFKHDPRAYTQGLLFHNGYLYESTGKEARSSVRKLNPANGEIVLKKALEDRFFGEGLALVGYELYMLTYTSQIGFVFDVESLEERRKFNLQTREGWGLTTFNAELVLSDGSAKLFFYEPEYFSLLREMTVCDNKGLVSQLNELEYTPYGIFANIYGKNQIVLIDENTGILKGIVDLKDLFPEGVPRNMDHVLNGIAYNPESGTFYVTGKQWPVMYEISITLD
jgi:glutamine cyclotransferase